MRQFCRIKNRQIAIRGDYPWRLDACFHTGVTSRRDCRQNASLPLSVERESIVGAQRRDSGLDAGIHRRQGRQFAYARKSTKHTGCPFNGLRARQRWFPGQWETWSPRSLFSYCPELRRWSRLTACPWFEQGTVGVTSEEFLVIDGPPTTPPP